MSNLRDHYKKLTTSVVVNKPVTTKEIETVVKENTKVRDTRRVKQEEVKEAMQARDARRAQREERRQQRDAVRKIKRGKS